jgi:tetratricopeptide (TPR) repeat protein
VSYNDQGYFVQAIANYTRAIELDPQNVLAHSNRGAVYNRMGDYYHEIDYYRQALDDLNRAIELDPEYASAYSLRGSAHSELGDLGSSPPQPGH